MADLSKAPFRTWWKEQSRLGIANRDSRSKKICEAIAGQPLFQGARYIGIYSARPTEVSLKTLWMKRPQACVLPKVSGEGTLAFYLIKDWGELTPGFKGILEPAGRGKPVVFGPQDLVLVPGMVFDAQGGRIGSGLGFYDKFLSKSRGVPWGVCWKEQIVDETLAQEPTDVRMGALCSDDGVRWLETE